MRLTKTEAAETARRHPDTIRKALEAGELHGTQPTRRGRWLIRSECLDAWLDAEQCEHQRSSGVRHLDELRRRPKL